MSTVGKTYYTVQVVSGEHQGQHRTYHTGDVFRTQYPLHEMFVNKFKLLPTTPAPIEGGPDTITAVQNAQQVKAGEPVPPVPPFNASSPVPPAPMSPYGEYEPYAIETYNFAAAKKVTGQFKDAKALGFDVWHHETDGYAVAEAGVPVPTNLAPSALATKKDVKEFLDSMKTPEMPD